MNSILAPSSRAALGRPVGSFSVLWAVAAPGLAFLIRDPGAISYDITSTFPLYLLCSIGFTLIALKLFRTQDGLVTYFSWNEAFDVMKAGAFVAMATCTALFTFTRLDGVPRSLPVVHAVILVAGFLLARLATSFAASTQQAFRSTGRTASRHAIVIGVNRLAFSYIRLLQSCAADRIRVVGLLDERRKLAGRRLSGVPIVGSPADLDAVIAEFAVHGVNVDLVYVAGGLESVAPSDAAAVQAICLGRSIKLASLSDLAGLPVDVDLPDALGDAGPEPDRRIYRAAKRLVDIAVASTALVALLPLLAAVSLIVLFGIGAPVLFWQLRLGVGGRPFLVYKFRTLISPFDAQGRPVPDDRRLSALGRFLRRTHFDELPQLLNILKGDMSLVGPRPLLAVDQPDDPAVRLSVRPGLTGWAQVNGGKLLTSEDKRELDEWYVRHVSLRVDLLVIMKTVGLLLRRTGAWERWEGDASSLAGAPARVHAGPSADRRARERHPARSTGLASVLRPIPSAAASSTAVTREMARSQS